MPLINYEIGDLVKTEDSTSAIIRHPDRITAFMGRKKDIFHFRNTSYTIGEIDAVVGRSDVTIAQYQIHTAKNKIKLYYTSLTDHPLSTEEKEVVQQNLEILFLQNLKVEFLHLFSISPEVSGKFSIVI